MLVLLKVGGSHGNALDRLKREALHHACQKCECRGALWHAMISETIALIAFDVNSGGVKTLTTASHLENTEHERIRAFTALKEDQAAVCRWCLSICTVLLLSDWR